MTYMQVNLNLNTAKMTKRGGDMRTDQIGKQCPDGLGM